MAGLDGEPADTRTLLLRSICQFLRDCADGRDGVYSQGW